MCYNELSRREWKPLIMRGVKPHPKTGILWLRLVTPAELAEHKAKLIRLGVDYKNELHRSLGTRDPKTAASAYAAKRLEIEEVWESWRTALRDGPQSLTFKQMQGLAVEEAHSLISAHEDNPFDLPPTSGPPPVAFVFSETSKKAIRASSAADRELFQQEVEYIKYGPEADRLRMLKGWQDGSGYLSKFPEVVTAFADGLKQLAGKQTQQALARHNIIALSTELELMLNFIVSGKQSEARRALESSLNGDDTEIERLKALSGYQPAPSFKTQSSKNKRKFVITFDQIIDAEAMKRSLGVDAVGLNKDTVKDFKRITGLFAKFRNSDNASTVRLSEVEEWQEAMQEEALHLAEAGKKAVSNRTINYRVRAVGTVISWGKKNKQTREIMQTAETIAGKVDAVQYRKKAHDSILYTKDEVQTVLKASRKEADSRLRWLPWLCAYTGIRISEAQALERQDFFQVDGLWFVKITTGGGRSLKTDNAERRIPIHPHLLSEGLIDWCLTLGETERLFNKGANRFVGRWIRSDKVGVTREELSPLHGFRHLFKGMCREAMIDSDAMDELMGHAKRGAGALYGSTQIQLPRLARWVEKIKPLLNE